MPASVLYMSMSLDGHIAGSDDRPDNPGGDGFMRLHEWLADGNPTARPDQPERCTTRWRRPVRCWWAGVPRSRPITTTAIITACRSWWSAAGRRRPRWPAIPSVTYVTGGIESAMAQAKAAAGDRDVLVHGAYTAQRALEAGVLDELQIHQIPVLFGQGRRLFDVLPSRVELEIVQVIDTPQATHIRYRVRR